MSSKITIHGTCRVIGSHQGTAGSPQSVPKEFYESENEAQRVPEELRGALPELQNDFNTKNKTNDVKFHETIGKTKKIVDFSSPESQLGVQI